MNYDQPRQIVEGPHIGKWQYTSANRRTGTHPIGLCWAPDETSDVDDPSTWPQHHHDTAEDARWCYTYYLRSKVTLRENATSWTTCDMPDCDSPARNLAQAGAWKLAALCDNHFSRLDAYIALGLNKPAGDSIHS